MDDEIFELEDNFVCGSYLGHCIDDIINQSKGKAYRIIKELVLYRPTDKQKPNIYNYLLISIKDVKEGKK